ncbi:hypothetical protein BCR33DRAFT_727891 [Rhizoclosmatium globosum]|uniref:Uncharacterized protein n=1 Tax=Rhizoclosmatium globosum TaxID=329046 RepID=A0A1Y2AMG9_9FUNG|nr:hypothetical protein BCR33DRAFT_727891 [Rhizoclosmatium globosum]|eukprot:ORY23773.1 hypothetical protein BCR33DRAFT_727891 [Rhizoclosmatium globosum]
MTVYARQHNFGSFRYDCVKLGAVHAEDTELFKSRMGSFHSPDVWITNPSEAVQSAFRNAFGTSRLLLSSDPGGRTVETQMASTGHVVQIGVGFEAVICRLQKRISTLQSFRDRAIDQIDTVIVLRSRVAAAELDLVQYASGDQVVAKETLRLENLVLAAEQELEARLKELRASARMVRKPTPGPDDMNLVDKENDVLDEVGRVDKELKKMRNEFNVTFDGGGVGGGGGDDTNLLSRLLKNAQDKLNKYAQRVRRSAAEWNSGADSYATSDFNSKTTNKKVTSGKDGIPKWVKTVLSYAAHASIRKQTTVMAYKKSENDGAFFNPGGPAWHIPTMKRVMAKEFDHQFPLVGRVGKIKAVVIVTEIGSTIMCFCGRISRIGKAKTFKCSNPRCSGRAICSRDSLTFRLPRDIKSGLFIENLTWAIALMRVHHHIRGGGTGGAENNDGNGDPGGGGPGGGRRGGKPPPAKKQRIVKGRLEYVAVEEVEREGRLDEGGIGSTSRQAEDHYGGSQQMDNKSTHFPILQLASRGAAGHGSDV